MSYADSHHFSKGAYESSWVRKVPALACQMTRAQVAQLVDLLIMRGRTKFSVIAGFAISDISAGGNLSSLVGPSQQCAR